MALDIDLKTIHEELQTVYGDKAPSIITIEKWSYYHREKKPNGTPSMVSSTEDTEEIRSLIDSIVDIIINDTTSVTTTNPLLDESEYVENK